MSEAVLFFLRHGPYGFLSNFYRQQQVVEGVMYPTNEHYYQSQKAADENVRLWIMAAPTPFLAMTIGRSLRPEKELRKDWNDETRIATMRKGLRAKFFGSQELAEKLLATASSPIVEDNSADPFWGNGRRGYGKNWLGKLLVDVRSDLQLARELRTDHS